MPIELYVIVSFMASVFLLAWLAIEFLECQSPTGFIPLLILVIIWSIIPASRKDDKITETTHEVVMVDGVACVSINGKIVNLNSETGRNYRQGDKVRIKTIEKQYDLFYSKDKESEYSDEPRTESL